MHPSHLHFLPLAPLFFFALVVLFVVAVGLILFGVLEYAYEKMGVSRHYVFAILGLSLLGSSVNIPVAVLPQKEVRSNVVVDFWGVQYRIPEFEDWHRTELAVNVGGAIIPTALAIYLLFKNGLYWQSIVGVLIVSLIVHRVAVPTRGVGIAVPIFIPPVVAAITALILSYRRPAPLAYIVGTLGTLIGADLMNLNQLSDLGAPVASIGGAGTFDGVFLTGLLAVLLA